VRQARREEVRRTGPRDSRGNGPPWHGRRPGRHDRGHRPDPAQAAPGLIFPRTRTPPPPPRPLRPGARGATAPQITFQGVLIMSAISTQTSRASHAVLALLVGGYASIFLGRQIMAVMIEPIKLEFHASDTAMGLISGLAFAGAYALMGLPAGALADRHSRVRLLALCAALWAVTTLLCGFAVSF